MDAVKRKRGWRKFWTDAIERIHGWRQNFWTDLGRKDERLVGGVMCQVFLEQILSVSDSVRIQCIILRSRKSFACSWEKMMNENNCAFFNLLIWYDTVFEFSVPWHDSLLWSWIVIQVVWHDWNLCRFSISVHGKFNLVRITCILLIISLKSSPHITLRRLWSPWKEFSIILIKEQHRHINSCQKAWNIQLCCAANFRFQASAVEILNDLLQKGKKGKRWIKTMVVKRHRFFPARKS